MTIDERAIRAARDQEASVGICWWETPGGADWDEVIPDGERKYVSPEMGAYAWGYIAGYMAALSEEGK